ncbi:MAG: tRNA(fMet)-specific endonuclease VapC [Methanosaeta sp. PtaU1.Bin112]|nr:MAG: tRNA(fMet)-specific endonuclease VapC [Methanosaeta sp. PtaU1.Bin112]
MTVLIDSWAWIEFFRGSTAGLNVKRYIESEEDLVVSTINIAEVYRWILRYYNETIAEEKLAAMKDRCTAIDVDERIAVDAARIGNELKWGLGDSIVRATANQEDAGILTGDSDFKGMKDVIFL